MYVLISVLWRSANNSSAVHDQVEKFEKKKARWLDFAVFAAITGPGALSDVWVQERSQQLWDHGVKGFTEYLYGAAFL